MWWMSMREMHKLSSANRRKRAKMTETPICFAPMRWPQMNRTAAHDQHAKAKSCSRTPQGFILHALHAVILMPA